MSEFVPNLANRIASAWTESHDTHFGRSDRGVRLPRELLGHDDYCRIAPVADPTPAPERPAIELLTVDGHMRPLGKIEADIIRLAICHYGGRVSEVARRLNIGRSTLYRKLDAFGIAYKP